MKAEDRKELKANSLVSGVQNFWRELWDGRRSTNVYVFGLMILLVLAVLVGLWFFFSISGKDSSALWLKVDDVANLKQMADKKDVMKSEADALKQVMTNIDQIATQNPGKMQARVVRFEKARLLLSEGIQGLGQALFSNREDVIKNIVEAIALYEALAKESSDNPALQQEAWLGAAKGHESIGNLPKAMEFYKLLANAKLGTDKISDQTKAAKEFVEMYEADGPKKQRLEAFYRDFRSKLEKAGNKLPQ
jgi:hypothetical protein